MFSFSNDFQVLEKHKSPHLVSELDKCEALRLFFIDTLILAKKPGGLTITENCSSNSPISDTESPGLSLDERLNLATFKNSNYAWKDDVEIIRLFPKNSDPELLKVRIKNLKIKFDRNLAPVVSQILASPEVVKKIKELQLKGGIQYGGLKRTLD